MADQDGTQGWTPERIAGLTDEVEQLAEANHQLLRQLDEARQRRILVLPAEGGGTCALCFTGRVDTASAHTWLEVRSDDALIRVEHVPVVECDTCGHLLLTMEDASRLETLLDHAEERDPELAPVVHLDWLDPAVADDSTPRACPVVGCGHPLEQHTATSRCTVEGCDGCPEDAWEDPVGEARHLAAVIEEAARLLTVTDAPRGEVADFLLSHIEGEHRFNDERGQTVIRWPGWDDTDGQDADEDLR